MSREPLARSHPHPSLLVFCRIAADLIRQKRLRDPLDGRAENGTCFLLVAIPSCEQAIANIWQPVREIVRFARVLVHVVQLPFADPSGLAKGNEDDLPSEPGT